MIDRQTGALVLGKLRIAPGIARSALPGARHEMGNGWTRIDLGPHRLGARTFLVSATFEGERLDGYSLCDADPRFGTSWDDADEPARRKAHDAWLAAALGPGPGAMPWGEAWSSLDPRGGSATIGVRFAKS